MYPPRTTREQAKRARQLAVEIFRSLPPYQQKRFDCYFDELMIILDLMNKTAPDDAPATT